MILTLIIASLTSAAPTCSLVGRVELMKNGKRADAESRVVVSVQKVPPSAISTEARPPQELLQAGLQFKPQLLVLMKGDTVVFTNEDKDEHSVHSDGEVTPGFDFPRSRKGVTGRQTFRFAGWSRVQCKIHDWMTADLLVLDNPFAAIAGADGAWKISRLPAGGEYQVVAREPNGGKTAAVTVKKCAGETRVTLPALAEEPLKKSRRKNPYIVQN